MLPGIISLPPQVKIEVRHKKLSIAEKRLKEARQYRTKLLKKQSELFRLIEKKPPAQVQELIGPSASTSDAASSAIAATNVNDGAAGSTEHKAGARPAKPQVALNAKLASKAATAVAATERARACVLLERALDAASQAVEKAASVGEATPEVDSKGSKDSKKLTAKAEKLTAKAEKWRDTLQSLKECIDVVEQADLVAEAQEARVASELRCVARTVARVGGTGHGPFARSRIAMPQRHLVVSPPSERHSVPTVHSPLHVGRRIMATNASTPCGEPGTTSARRTRAFASG